MKSLIIFIGLMTSLLSYAEPAIEAITTWNERNNPYRLDANFIAVFDSLPTEGKLKDENLAWPAYFWARNKAGIARRWSAKKERNFKYKSPELYKLQNMKESQINLLSPAEKYDIYMESYDYPTVKLVRSQSDKTAGYWQGICHGAAPASAYHTEPKRVTLTNNDGVKITFYASDVKALLAYHYAKINDQKATLVGNRCYLLRTLPTGIYHSCKDVNAGAFHIILTNRLGLQNKSFIADLDPFRQVWNHSALSYKSTIVSSSSTKVRIKTTVHYNASAKPSYDRMVGTARDKHNIRRYEYEVKLNSNGEIIGGRWISRTRPDFVWEKPRSVFEGYWAGIEEIYNASVGVSSLLN
jgi:hypothetical protein